MYLQEKLSVVAKRRSGFDLSDPWPCDEDLTALAKKSSGLFIFASTLARFIKSEHHEPNECLQLIVTPSESTVHEGRAGIDPLYTRVFVYAFSNVEEDAVFANLRRVLGAVVLAFNPLSQVQIAKILNIKPSLIIATLRHLRSVLLIVGQNRCLLALYFQPQTPQVATIISHSLPSEREVNSSLRPPAMECLVQGLIRCMSTSISKFTNLPIVYTRRM